MNRSWFPTLALSLALGLAVMVALLTVGSVPAFALGVPRYVATGGTDDSDCTDPDDPCATVQHAVDEADGGDVVKVAAGTYSDVHGRPAPAGYQDPPVSGIVDQIVYISKTVTIRGGYAAPGYTEPPAPLSNPTTLDAQGLGRGVLIWGDISPTLAGLRITGGDSSGLGGGTDDDDAGGGVYVSAATATITNCQVYTNTGYDGGGLYLEGSSATLDGTEVAFNTAYRGGGLYLWNSDAALIGNTIANNTAVASGGGLSLAQSPATLRNNMVSDNTSELSGGGGLRMFASDALLTGNMFLRNTASGSGGGGIELAESDATLVNNVVADNTSGQFGAGVAIYCNSPRLIHTTIAGNTGDQNRGLKVKRWDMVPCPAPPSAVLTNTILVRQTVGVWAGPGATVMLEATLWGTDTWANDTDWESHGTVSTGSVNVWDDPAFVDPGTGDYHIRRDSAAVDAGVDAGVTTDIDGDTRPFGSGFDIGADERWCRYIFLPVVMRNVQ